MVIPRNYSPSVNACLLLGSRDVVRAKLHEDNWLQSARHGLLQSCSTARQWRACLALLSQALVKPTREPHAALTTTL